VFDVDNYIEEFRSRSEQQEETKDARDYGRWLRGAITVFSIMVAGYTTVHGISATLHFRATGALGVVTGITGILVLEGLFLVLSHGLINGTFRGGKLHVGFMVAGATVSLAFMLLNTVVDAQLNAGDTLGTNLYIYFRYGLPIASVVAVVIALVGLYFAPEAERARLRGAAINEFKQHKFNGYMAAQQAELMVQDVITNAQLGARVTAAKTVSAYYQSQEVRQQIEQAAVAAIPALLRQIGVPGGEVVEGEPVATMAADGQPAPEIHPRDYADTETSPPPQRPQ
jgi:hypothetical protein